MDMLTGAEITDAALVDWRKLAQGFHARFLIDDFSAGAHLISEVGRASSALGHYPSVSMAAGHVDFTLVSADAVYRDDDGTELIVEWVTQQDVDLARVISDIASGLELTPDPSAVTVIELGLETERSSTIAPVWAALLTGDPTAQGHGSPSDEIRDPTGRVPNLWFGPAQEQNTEERRFHIEIYVSADVVKQRLAAALDAGGTVTDDSQSPALTVVADQDGNTAALCVA